MGFNGNVSTEKTVTQKTLFTGLGDFKIIAVNPTAKALESVGVKLKNEPAYISETDEGVKRVRVDFWIKEEVNTDIVTKVSLWLEDRIYVGKTKGKTQFINSYGKTSWGTAEEEGLPKDFSTYFKTKGARPAYKGEEELHNFLSCFLNTIYDTRNDKYDECLLENTENLFKGDFSELKGVIKMFKDNTIRILLGVDDNGYQQTYNKFFEKTCVSPNYKKWNSILEEDYKTFNADFQNDFELKPYIPVPKVETSTDNDISSMVEDDEELL
jgi:hypothetical protein